MLKKLWLVAACSCIIAIIVLYFANPSHLPQMGFEFQDKVQHFLAFFVLTYLWVCYFNASQNASKTWLIGFAIIVFGFVLEILQQKLNPNRVYDLYDILANTIGVLVGTLVAFKINLLTKLK